MNNISASQDVRRSTSSPQQVESTLGNSDQSNDNKNHDSNSQFIGLTQATQDSSVLSRDVSGAVLNTPDTSSWAKTDSQTVATRIKLSLSQLTTIRWSMEDELARIKGLGFDAIGLWRPKVTEFGDEAAIEALQQSEVGVSSLSFVGGFTGRNGFSFEDAVADGRDAIRDARALGAENVIVVGGPRNWHTVQHCRHIVVAALCELAEHAMLHGIKLSLLPMQRFFAPTWTFLNSIDETLDVLAQVGHPSVNLAFDTYHFGNEPRLFDRIADLAPFTGIVQISDSRRSPQTDADRCFPGDGRIPVEKIVRSFQLAGFSGYFDLQVWSDSEWALDSETMGRTCQMTSEALHRATTLEY